MIREFQFAKKYNLEIKTVVKPSDKDDNFTVKDEAYSGPGILINSEYLNDLKVPMSQLIKQLNF